MAGTRRVPAFHNVVIEEKGKRIEDISFSWHKKDEVAGTLRVPAILPCFF